MKTPDDIISPGLTRFVALRPKAIQHLNYRTGVYWHVFAGQRAMAARALARVASLVAANRLSASGQDLIDYVNSEFTEILGTDLEGTFALGEITLVRPALDDDGNPAPLLAGDVPRGSVITRPANAATEIPVTNADYVTVADYHFNAGQLVSGPIPIQAKDKGTGANHPIRTVPVPHNAVNGGAAFFDTTLTVQSFSAAGGSEAFGGSVNFEPVDKESADNFVRRFAKAYSKGQYAPNADAAIYGAIRGTGARNVITFDDVSRSVLKVQAADASWASSDRWCKSVQQQIYDAKLVGFGCVVEVIPVRNKIVTVQASVTLRDWNYTADTVAVDDAIRAAVAAYFDDRPDWNVYKNRALKNVITRADSKILKCSSVQVFDALGQPVDEIASPDYTTEQFHFYLPSKAVTVSYVGPG